MIEDLRNDKVQPILPHDFSGLSRDAGSLNRVDVLGASLRREHCSPSDPIRSVQQRLSLERIPVPHPTSRTVAPLKTCGLESMNRA